ncbi:hypothetical protein HAX54_018510 [Datura stramonium]|uniref:Uncharacterized protein n=1 Tax=Datura stramonium TaxID=4076 RepID=A0ABS8S3P3_DATST|nr:hypothetical protein [Datura stramonium]
MCGLIEYASCSSTSVHIGGLCNTSPQLVAPFMVVESPPTYPELSISTNSLEIPLFNLLTQVSNIDPLAFPPFFFHQQVSEATLNPWSTMIPSQELTPAYSTMVYNNVGENPTLTIPNNIASTSQVLPHAPTSPNPN